MVEFWLQLSECLPHPQLLIGVGETFTTIDISTQATSHVLPGPVLYQYQYPYPTLVWGPALPAAVYGGAAVPPDDVITEDGLKLELLVTR